MFKNPSISSSQISQVDKDSVRRLAEEAARRWQERDDKAFLGGARWELEK